jgi:hypothetical protein
MAGASNDAAGLLQAQKDAPHSQAGAVGFAAAVLRWIAQYPRPNAKDGTTVAASILARGATGTIANLATNMASAKTLPGVNSGSLNFSDGRYMVEEATSDMVRVTVGGAEVQNSKPTNQNIASTFTMVWESGVWKVRSDGTELSLGGALHRRFSVLGGVLSNAAVGTHGGQAEPRRTRRRIG